MCTAFDRKLTLAALASAAAFLPMSAGAARFGHVPAQGAGNVRAFSTFKHVASDEQTPDRKLKKHKARFYGPKGNMLISPCYDGDLLTLPPDQVGGAALGCSWWSSPPLWIP